MNKKYLVKLTDEERHGLQTLLSQGRAAARKITRAWILLKADVGLGPGWSDEEIHTTFAVGLATIYRVRQTFVEEGLDAVLTRCPKSRHRPRKLDGEQEARLSRRLGFEAPRADARGSREPRGDQGLGREPRGWGWGTVQTLAVR